MNDRLKSLFALAALGFGVLLAPAVLASTYYWVGEDYGLFGETNNWRIGSAEGETPETCPGKSDTLYGLQSRKMDLGGETYEISGWNSTGNWSRYATFLTNGTLRATGGIWTHSDDVTLSNNARLIIACEFHPATGDASTHAVYINDGCDYQILGKFSNYKTWLYCYKGGHFLFEPTSFSVESNSGQNSRFDITGTMDAPHGVNWTSGGTKYSSNYQLFQLESGGLMRLGAGFFKTSSLKGMLQLYLQGGTLAVTGDVSFVNTECRILKNSNVTLDVAEGVKLDLSSLTVSDSATVETGAVVTKTGEGLVLLAAEPKTLTMEAGAALVQADLSDLAFEGDTIVLKASRTENTLPSVSGKLLVGGTSKVKLSVRDLYRLADGTYTLVAAGNTLTLDQYDVELDPSVNATLAVTAEGALTVTVAGPAEDPDPLVWNPQNASDVWSETCSAWLDGDTQKPFVYGRGAKFTGTEETVCENIRVDGEQVTCTLEVEGGADYVIVGEEIGTRSVIKRGSGTLTIDNEGISGRQIELRGGTLAFGGDASSYVSNAISVVVPADAQVAVKGVQVTVERALHLFRYGSNDIDYKTGTEFTTTNLTDSIACFNTLNPLAPDGKSLSGKSVWISGTFHVSSAEAGSWSFKGIYDDRIILIVDGVTLFSTTGHKDEKTATVNLAAGEHSFDIRAYDGSGNWGHTGYCIAAKSPRNEDYLPFDERSFTLQGSNRPAPDQIALALSAASSSKVTFASTGIVIDPTSVLADTALLAIDIQSVPANVTFLRCEDAALMATVKAKLSASLGSLGKIVDTEDGIGWEMKAVFDSATVTDLDDKDGWMIGVVPGPEEHVTINGSYTKPVMTAETTGFAEMTLTGGAELTIAETRSVNAITLSAGTTLKVGANATVTAAGAFTTKDSGTVTVDVAEGAMLDLSSVTVLTEAKLVKTGSGTIFFGESAPSNAQISEGTVAFTMQVPYDLSGMAFGEGVAKTICVNGVLIPATGLYDETTGKTTFYGRGTYRGTGDWETAANWIVGAPTTNDQIFVLTDSTLTVNTNDFTLGKIWIQDSATVKVTTAMTLPDVSLAATARLELGDGVKAYALTLSSVPETAFRLDGDDVFLSKFVVHPKVTLTIPSASKFKNVDIELSGTMKKASTDGVGPTFGTAASGETSYLAFTATNAEFAIYSYTSAENGKVAFVNPTSGGRVKVVGDILIRNCEFPISSWAHYGWRTFGVNNPTDEPFMVVLDKTTLKTGWSFIAGGAAHLKLINGSSIDKYWNCRNHGFDSYIQNLATVECIGSGSFLDYSGHVSAMRINSSDEVDAFVVRDGGAYLPLYAGGTAKGLLVSSNGVFGVNKLSESRSPSDLLNGFKSVRLEPDSVTRIASVNLGQLGSSGSQWNRKVQIANIPITGSGDLVVTNGVPSYPLSVTVKSGANTCTGTIGLSTQTAGAKETLLLFNTGANWAGTVGGAGVITLTNLTTAAGAATVTFGKLGFAEGGAVKLRVWKDAEGVISANDVINLTQLGSTGTVEVEMQDGAVLNRGESFVLGTAPKGAWSGVKIRSGRHACVVREKDAGEGLVTCRVKLTSGLSIIVR